MTAAIILKWASIVISILLGLLTAGNAASTAFNGGFGAGEAPVVAATGIGAIFAGLLAFVPNLVSAFWPAGNANQVPKELADAIAALEALAQNPSDVTDQRNALLQSIEVIFAVGQAVIPDPALDSALAALEAIIVKQFSPLERAKLAAAAPVVVHPPIVAAAPAGPITFAEAVKK